MKRKYPKEFYEKSAKLRRKGYCEICGALNGHPHPSTGSKVVLTVHHIDLDIWNNDDANLIQLCQSCHLDIHRTLNKLAVKSFVYEAKRAAAVMIDGHLIDFCFEREGGKYTFEYKFDTTDNWTIIPVSPKVISPSKWGYRFNNDESVKFLFDEQVTFPERFMKRKIAYHEEARSLYRAIEKDNWKLTDFPYDGIVFYENNCFYGADTRGDEAYVESFDALGKALKYVYAEAVHGMEEIDD